MNSARTPQVALLVARGLTKAYPAVVAVDDVDLALAPGEIVALLGQNGAGKSTLIQILSGVHPVGSYAGEVSLGGRPFQPASVHEAERAGVAFLAQELNVASDLSVCETVFLHDEPTRYGLIDVPLRLARTRALLADFGLDVDAEAPMGSLDLVNQQLVLVVRALSKEAQLLILDEPTAALTSAEVERLFARLRRLAARGVAIIFVSHRLHEVFEIADRIVVMRDGRIRGDHRTVQTTRSNIVAEMVGRALFDLADEPPARLDAAALAVKGLSVRGGGEARAAVVDGLDLSIGRGEIVGLFGLLGSGCTEAAMAMFGAGQGARSGEIFVGGAKADIGGPRDAVALGLGLVAQDRREGLCGEHSIIDNVILADLAGVSLHGVIDVAEARRLTGELVTRLAIKAHSIDSEVGTLSGGNQQKVQVARWLAAGADALILIDPTRGVDVGARQEIKRIWMDLRASGRAILLVSSDSEETAEICDRVVVMRAGRSVGELSGERLNERNLLRLAAGA